MGVTTTADEKLQSAREHIRQAYSDILEVVDPDTWGHSELRSSYVDTLEEILTHLRKMKKLL